MLSLAINYKVYKQYKAIIVDISKKIKAITKQKLVSYFKSRYYFVSADSTVSISFSSLTESKSLETTEFEEYNKIKYRFLYLFLLGASNKPYTANF